MLINKLHSPVSLVCSNFKGYCLFVMIMTRVFGREGVLREESDSMKPC
jgi:hypothetical protein